MKGKTTNKESDNSLRTALKKTAVPAPAALKERLTALYKDIIVE